MGSRPRWGAATLGSVVVALAMLLPTAADARPLIVGGQPTPGNPAVVAMAVLDGSTWRVCNAALLRPRVLVTAAHCLVRQGTDRPVQKVRIFPPGVRARIYGNTGPVRPSPVRVVKWWLAADRERDITVGRDDVAVMLLTRDLAPQAVTAIATQSQLTAWRDAQTPVTHVGYGTRGGRAYSQVPQTIALPFRSFAPTDPMGSTFSTASTATSALCPGDSGSPALVTAGDATYLVGTMAGVAGSCGTRSTDGQAYNLGFTTIGYLPEVNNAFAEAGYLRVPSAPQRIAQTARNRDVTVQWQQPAQAPDTVAAYDVTDAAGHLACQTTTTTCVIPGLPDGSYRYTVRARNAENEGDGLPPSTAAAVVAAPPAPAAPTATRVARNRYTITVTTLASRTSAVVQSYVVRDRSGIVLCTLVPPTQSTPSLTCPGPTRRGTYAVTVQAQTEMGPSPVSPTSASFTITR